MFVLHLPDEQETWPQFHISATFSRKSQKRGETNLPPFFNASPFWLYLCPAKGPPPREVRALLVVPEVEHHIEAFGPHLLIFDEDGPVVVPLLENPGAVNQWTGSMVAVQMVGSQRTWKRTPSLF